MTAPDFIAQSGEPMTADEARAWFRERGREMHEQGATWFQYSVDDVDEPKLHLVEGWRQQPKEQNEADLRVCAGRRSTMGAKVATPARVRYPRPLIDRFLCTTCRDVERWTSRVLIVTLVGILIIGHAGNFLGQ